MRLRLPFFTIITATYNAAGTLPRLLESLAEQTCRDFVWVCQDGGSSDETRAVVEEWKHKLPAISFVSEKDMGIYDAWNKAIAREGDVLGQWVLFLGADDLLAAPDVLERVKEKLLCLPESVLFGVGEMQFFAEGKEFSPTRTDIDFSYNALMFGCPFPHTALFSRGRLFAVHAFDAAYAISGDYDWLIRTWDRRNQAQNLNILTTYMACGGVSSTPQNEKRIFFEYVAIYKKHFPKRWKKYTFLLFLQHIETKTFDKKEIAKAYCLNNKILAFPWRLLQALRKKLFPMKY